MNIKEAFCVLPQYILPHHPLSRAMGILTHSTNKTWKNLFIRQIIRFYDVDISDAEEQNIDSYACFNDFFTRALKREARPVADAENAVASPADGTVSQAGDIVHGRIIQAKGKAYNVVELLGGEKKRAEPFEHGKFATIYLSPRDYHRLHMPVGGTLKEMVHVPGRLFSVNEATADSVPNLFARNERVAAIFDTDAGPMALVLVGAIFVASIETVWHGVVTPPTSKTVYQWRYPNNPPVLKIGDEMGRFNMGSTVIVLFGRNKIEWSAGLGDGRQVRMGQQIGETVV